jgi:hypothetical protein
MSCTHHQKIFDSVSRIKAFPRSFRSLASQKKASFSKYQAPQQPYDSNNYQLGASNPTNDIWRQSCPSSGNPSNLNCVASLSQRYRSGRPQLSCQAEESWSDMTSPVHKSDPEDQLPAEEDHLEGDRDHKKARVEPPAGQVKISGFANVALRSVLKGKH